MNPCEEMRQFFIKMFHEKGEACLPFLVNSTVSKQLWLWKYKSLPPIEQMEEKEKREMKAYVIAMFPEKTTEEKLDACKIIYSIGLCL